jgi:hypothetical protein
VDQLAFFFAHELHHFRRYHLSFHPRQGEHGANAWARDRCQELGFSVASHRLPVKPVRRKRSGFSLAQVLNPFDFFPKTQMEGFKLGAGFWTRLSMSLNPRERKRYIEEKSQHFSTMRKLPAGSSLWITFDPHHKYLFQQVSVIRSMRAPSVRILIETTDGKLWRWPMSWLSFAEPCKR